MTVAEIQAIRDGALAAYLKAMEKPLSFGVQGLRGVGRTAQEKDIETLKNHFLQWDGLLRRAQRGGGIQARYGCPS
jgi:hypothetical protein